MNSHQHRIPVSRVPRRIEAKPIGVTITKATQRYQDALDQFHQSQCDELAAVLVENIQETIYALHDELQTGEIA